MFLRKLFYPLIVRKSSLLQIDNCSASSSQVFIDRKVSLSSNVALLIVKRNDPKRGKMDSKKLDSCFKGTLDVHKGVLVDSSLEPCADEAELKTKLAASLAKWNTSGVRGVWFKVAITHAFWLPILAENGFQVHHGKKDMITMSRWLPQDEVCRIPIYAHSMVGVGAVVINDKQQVLVVCERYREVPYWKLPGGYVEPREDLVAAAVREVKEETNIDCGFVSMLSFRHSYKAAFGCSDYYFVFRLKPFDPSQPIIPQEQEVENAKWMDVNEYLNHPMVHQNNRFFVQKAVEYEQNNLIIEQDTAFHPVTGRPQAVYSLSCRHVGRDS